MNLVNFHSYPTEIVEWIKSLAYGGYKISKRLKNPPFGWEDFQTFDLIKRLPANANCIDVGAHKAMILKRILRQFPDGKHFAFEPIPVLYKKLQRKFGKKVEIHNVALSNKKGIADFFVCPDRPAISGLKKRNISSSVRIEKVQVQTDRLDDIIPYDIRIHLIKIDVEGAELMVLKGAVQMLKRYKPIVLFECGMGGSNFYDTTPEQVWNFFTTIGYQVSLLEYFLWGKDSLSLEEFIGQYEKGYNYFFVAYVHDLSE